MGVVAWLRCLLFWLLLSIYSRTYLLYLYYDTPSKRIEKDVDLTDFDADLAELDKLDDE